jgi:hypothetical protein
MDACPNRNLSFVQAARLADASTQLRNPLLAAIGRRHRVGGVLEQAADGFPEPRVAAAYRPC